MKSSAAHLQRPLREVDPDVYQAVQNEVSRQVETLELIASENFTSEAVLEATGSVFTNKYAEGYPGRRYYGGCEHADVVESLARERAKQLFGAEHANVQPHSGTQANIAVYETILQEGDPVLGMNLNHGGHLTHGHKLNFSGKHYRFIPYGVRRDTETIDYDQLQHLAQEHRPKLLVAGASAYARIIDFERMAAIARSVDALFMMDMAHIAGLIAVGNVDSDGAYRSAAERLFGSLSEDFDAAHGVFESKRVYNVDDVAWLIGGLNSLAQKGDGSVKRQAKEMLLAFYESTISVAGMQLSAPPGKNGAMAGGWEKNLASVPYYHPANTPPPAMVGALPVPAEEITWDGNAWSVTSDRFVPSGAMHLANELNWLGPHLGSIPFPKVSR